MLYLLDANTLIDANRDYYPIGRVDEYWEWLVHHGDENRVKIPIEIFEEITEGKQDELASWAKSKEVKDALLFGEEADIALVQKVTEEGYASDLNDIELIKVGRDPFLISYGLAVPASRTIVTTEASKPGRKRHNRRVPDVCDHFHVKRMNAFEFVRALDFRTDWKEGSS